MNVEFKIADESHIEEIIKLCNECFNEETDIEEAKKILEAYDIVYLFLTEILQVDDEKAEKEASKIKATLNDETLNKLAIYTHKSLGLHSLECGYDINNEKCLKCARRKKNV